ncbi:uncharacterized protein THITE_2111453 [Thermothielavioides terrestris NRRL 8126]|uniref:SET domain-containing protein n=1 Tax=Thermothielavioides terrestris (strain ATCC 38088 / NRRL 8126) TaxID=578455 RepID=G2R2C4_THETT|nr:uncharacterized protein THITE_2111453 [Thermothielavioides terrestris NRRL 8126]AEO64992.1 hypothetical protein THITE_2111453 [Thermothielavioides terrestris NRRL 8126]
MATLEAAPTMAELDTLLLDASSFSSSTPSDRSSANSASLSSTPPTTISPDSMSLASEPDAAKPLSAAASSIEAVIASPKAPETAQQNEPRQQTPVGHDAIVVAEQPLPAEPPSNSRPRRARSSLPVYNLARLAGTDVHGRRRSKGDAGLEKRRRTVSEATLAAPHDGATSDSTDAPAGTAQSPARIAPGALPASPTTTRTATRLSTPRSARISKKSRSIRASPHLTRRSTRLSGAPVEDLATKLSALNKRGKKAAQKALGGLSRELKRLQDTNEFLHIDTRPVRYTVWSNGKYVDTDPSQPTAPEPPRKKVKVDKNAAGEQETSETGKPEAGVPATNKPRVKKWLEKGLYAGQEAPVDIFQGLTAQEKKKLASIPELLRSSKPNRTFPLPMYNGLRILIHGRDFKLPFDICNPLPPGQPKPAAYRTMTKNRFVGNAAAYWKKTPHFGDFASKCVCKPEDGCGEDCQNRIMLYECDETNCNIGREYCTNRAFQDLQERTKKGGRYRVGVEVFKTPDRGYGVRSNRCFEPNQIIMEYTGEIITEEECERRMNEEYKDNECYYLMSFDQNMIIDATTGSIARFVNHSCSPNCRMIKWIVSGQPRMALFAGDRPIMTGEELTYDYNFDPFSAKNVQKCLCGSANCRGVLGPKPKEVKPPKQPPKQPSEQEKKLGKGSSKVSAKGTGKGSAKAPGQSSAKPSAKRKLKDAFEFDGDDEVAAGTAKKRKLAATVGPKRTLSSASLKGVKGAAKGAAKKATKGATKGAVTAIKRGGLSISVAAKKRGLSSKSAKTKTVKKGATTTALGRISKKTTYGKKSQTVATATTTKAPKPKAAAPSRSPSLTIVAAGVESAASASATATPVPQTTPRKAAAAIPASSSSRKQLPKLTISGGKTSARKWTPSRKAIEAGLADKSPAAAASAKSSGASDGAQKTGKGLDLSRTPKIKLVNATKSN